MTDEAVNFCVYRVVLPLNIFIYAISLNKLSLSLSKYQVFNQLPKVLKERERKVTL